jgi:hypothetical protein
MLFVPFAIIFAVLKFVVKQLSATASLVILALLLLPVLGIIASAGNETVAAHHRHAVRPHHATLVARR